MDFMNNNTPPTYSRSADISLHLWAAKNKLVQVKQLLSGGDAINELGINKRTPLHYAAVNNVDDSHFEVIETLLKCRADVNARDDLNQTPLFYLVRQGNLKIVQLLLNYKADINVINPDGENLLFFAAYNRNSSKIMQLLVGLGLDVNHRCYTKERTPLHIVALNNEGDSHFKVSEVLLKIGAQVNARDNEGSTPLWYLVKNGNAKIVRLFLNCKADINVVDKKGRTLLFLAIDSENTEVAQLLIDSGLNVNHRDYDGYTPLKIARHSVKMMKCLLKNGVTGMSKMVIHFDYREIRNEETREKTLNFIIDHTDFNQIHADVDRLTFEHYFGFYEFNGITIFSGLILKHLAKLQTLNMPVHSFFLSSLPAVPRFNDYCNLCQKELVQAKSVKLRTSWITFFNLLVDGRRKLKNYAGNKDLIAGLKKSDFEEKFPIYGASMYKNMEKGIKRRELFEKASITLSNCLPVFNPNHLIIRDVLDCVISKKYLSKFCE